MDPRALASQVLLLTDEVSLTASVQYKSSGEIAGLADPDTIIVNCMDANRPQLATMGLAFMIRSFGTAGARPLAFFLQGGSTAVYLFRKLFEIQMSVEEWGVTVHGVTGDGYACSHRINGKRILLTRTLAHCCSGSVNRAAFTRYSLIPWIPDFTHVLKNIRNNFNLKKMRIDGHRVDWRLVSVYVRRVVENYAGRLSATTKPLTVAHVDLDARSKMKVSLAAEIFCSDFVRCFKEHYKQPSNLPPGISLHSVDATMKYI